MARLPKAKRCPFCASTDSFVECMSFGSFAVVCNGCLARGPEADGDSCDPDGENARGKRGALREWNKRRRASASDAGGVSNG